MSSSLTTCSSRAEDEFSSDVFGQGGNAEVNDGGTTTSVSDGNSRKTIIDGGMKRKMTEFFILTVVNITVTVALISFITPNENGRINSELESLKKFVEKMEQQRGNNGGQQIEFCAKMDTDKEMVKAIETKFNELEEQQKKEAIVIGVLKDRFEKEREMPTNEAGEEKLSQFQNDQKKLLKKISELEKQQKEQTKVTGDQLSKNQNDQKKLLEKISEMEKQSKVTGDQLSKSQNDQKKLLERISKMEKQQKEQSKVTGEQLSKSQNDQKKLLEKISEMEKQQKEQSKGLKMIFCILSPLIAILLHGGADILHLILNMVLYLCMTNILGNILGRVPGSIHALWYCFFSS